MRSFISSRSTFTEKGDEDIVSVSQRRAEVLTRRRTTDLFPSVSERVLCSQELKERHSQSEVVHGIVVLLSLEHLWRHVSCGQQSE